MAIRGDLLSVDLSNVFQMLSMNRKRGVLHIQDQSNLLKQRALVVDEDQIGLLDLPPNQDVWALLVDSGSLSYEEFRTAQNHAGEYNVSRTQLLSQKGLVTDEQVEQGRRRFQEEQLLEIFLWREISFTLDEEAEALPEADRVMFNVDLIVMEAARRQDEWLRAADLLGGANDIWARPPMPSFASQPDAEGLTDTEKIVLDHVDGVRDTDSIMKATALPRFHIDLALCKLMNQRLIRRLNGGELVFTATQLLEKDRVHDAIRLLNRAQEHDEHSMEIHLRLAEAHLKENAISKAAEHYKKCSEVLIEHGQFREAVDIFSDVLQLVPTDFETLKRVLAVLAQDVDSYTESDQEMFEQGVKLFHFHLEASQYDEANDLLGHLIEIAPNDLGLNMQRARLLTKQGFIEEGVQVYIKVAGRLFVSQDYEGAASIYRTVLGFELFNPKVSAHCNQKLEQIAQFEKKKDRRKAFGFGVVSMMAGLLLLGAGYFVYHDRAQSALVEIQDRESSAQSESDWVVLENEYESLAERYPFTFASARAQTFAKDARHTVAVFGERRREEKRLEEERRDKELTNADTLFRTAMKDLRDQRYGRALEKLRKSLELAESLDRRGWAVSSARQIPKRIEDLEKHVERGLKTFSVWQDAHGAQDWEAAHRAAQVILMDAYSADMSSTEVRLVDRDILEQIRVPIRVERIPGDATLEVDDEPVGPGAPVVQLSLERPTAKVTLRRTGSATREIELDWRSSPFDSVISTHRAPDFSYASPIPPAYFIPLNGNLGVFSDNASFALLAGQGERPKWRKDRKILVSMTAPPLARGSLVYAATSDGRVEGLDTVGRRSKFQWAAPEGSVSAMALHGNELWLGTTADHPLLVKLDATTGREVARYYAEENPVSLAVFSNGLLYVTAKGRIYAGPSAKHMTKLDGGPYRTELGVDAEGVAITNTSGALFVWRDRVSGLKSKVMLPESVVFSAGPTRVGSNLIANTSDGKLVVGSSWGEWSTFDAIGRARRYPWSSQPLRFGGDILTVSDDGALWQFNAKTGQIEAIFRSGVKRVLAATLIGNQLHVAYDGQGRKIEVYELRR